MYSSNLIQENTLRSLAATPSKPTAYIEPALMAVLVTRYNSGKRYQISKGIQFDLSFDEFLTLVGAGKRNTIRKHIKAETLDKFFRSHSGYCLSWKDKASLKSRVMSVETAVYVTRRKSKRVNQFEAGDKHSEESKSKISKAKTGKPRSKKARAAIRAGLMGHEVSAESREKMAAAKRGTTKSPEERARISATMKATKAVKKAALMASQA